MCREPTAKLAVPIMTPKVIIQQLKPHFPLQKKRLYLDWLLGFYGLKALS
jgi:hypothetical protein